MGAFPETSKRAWKTATQSMRTYFPNPYFLLSVKEVAGLKVLRHERLQLLNRPKKTKKWRAWKRLLQGRRINIGKNVVRTVCNGTKSTGDPLWSGVMSMCSKSSMNRSQESLRTKWRRLARNTQIYLACRETILKKRPSGTNEVELESLITDLYRKKPGRKDKDGIFMYAT